MTLPANIKDAIKCGPVPVVRTIEEIEADFIERDELTELLSNDLEEDDAAVVRERLDEIKISTGEEVIYFAYHHLKVPEGMKLGQPILFEPFQMAFIIAIFDNPHGTRFAYLSVAARNGKTLLLAVILLAYLIGPLAVRNSGLASGAMSREQAGICFDLMHRILLESPDCAGLWDAVPSGKKLYGLKYNTKYQALSADAKTGYGQSFRVILLDEAARVKGPSSAFTDMLESRQGSFDDGLFLTISTQATSDLDYLSVLMDNAERNQDKNTVSHLYCADPEADLLDEAAWYKANPGLGIFRSEKDLAKLMEVANQLEVKESEARNQFLNQRVAATGKAIGVNAWKRCSGEIDLEVFRKGPVHAGLDLSARNDLVACVLAAEDDDQIVHLLPLVFCPTVGIEERARRDKAPYDAWVRDGHMLGVGSATMDLDQIAQTIADELELLDITLTTVQYDKAYMKNFIAACERCGVLHEPEYVEVPQFFKDMGSRLFSFQALLLENKVRHGNSPPLNMSAAVAIAKKGREGVSVLAKDLSTQRIDPIVAAVMACWPFGDGREHIKEFDASNWVG